MIEMGMKGHTEATVSPHLWSEFHQQQGNNSIISLETVKQ